MQEWKLRTYLGGPWWKCRWESREMRRKKKDKTCWQTGQWEREKIESNWGSGFKTSGVTTYWGGKDSEMSGLWSGQNLELSLVALMESGERCAISLESRMEPELTLGSVLAHNSGPVQLAKTEQVMKWKLHTIISMNFQLTEAVNPGTVFRHHQVQRPNSDSGALPLSPCFSSSCLTHCLNYVLL